jgi:hypothetical protein
MSSLKSVFSRYAGWSSAVQLAFQEYLGEHTWNANLQDGTIDFGSGRVFPVQFLGSESEVSGTWLWGWANEGLDAAPRVLEACGRAREFGRQEGIVEFVEPRFPLTGLTGHSIAMTVAGVVGNCAYYRGPYGNGAAYLLVGSIPEKLLAPTDCSRAVAIITRVISVFELDHRIMVRSFLASQEFAIDETDRRIVGSKPGGRVEVTIDKKDRIVGARLRT